MSSLIIVPLAVCLVIGAVSLIFTQTLNIFFIFRANVCELTSVPF